MGWISAVQFERDHAGHRYHCAACGRTATAVDPLVLDVEGSRIHRGHALDPASGMFGTAQQSASRPGGR